MTFDLDPDFRLKHPRDEYGRLLPFCVKCQRKVDPTKVRKAWVNWETHKVSLNREEVAGNHSPAVIAEEFIGNDCWKMIGLPK